jgi:hypothetical protein
MIPEHKETYNKIDRYAALAEEIRLEILDRIRTVVEADPDYADESLDLIKETEIQILERLSTWLASTMQIEYIKTELNKFDNLRP